jgi:hypothetical protein
MALGIRNRNTLSSWLWPRVQEFTDYEPKFLFKLATKVIHVSLFWDSKYHLNGCMTGAVLLCSVYTFSLVLSNTRS